MSNIVDITSVFGMYLDNHASSEPTLVRVLKCNINYQG